MNLLNIIFEDKDILVIEKPFGLPMDRRETETFDCVTSEVLKHFKETNQRAKNLIAGIVHRIDRPVSGLLVLAKKQSILKKLNSSLEESDFAKHYLAICIGETHFKQEKIKHYHSKNTKEFKAEIYEKAGEGRKKIELELNTLQNNTNMSLVHVRLKTGRYHQIRAQLSFLGFPIWNDALYGSEKFVDENRIALLSNQLHFMHPVRDELLEFEIKPPQDLAPWNKFE